MTTLLQALVVLFVAGFFIKSFLFYVFARIFGLGGTAESAGKAALLDLILTAIFGFIAVLFTGWTAFLGESPGATALGSLVIAALAAGCVSVRVVYGDEDGNWFLAAACQVVLFCALAGGVTMLATS